MEREWPSTGSSSCNRCGRTLSEPEPLLFSFNSPVGACPTCQGFGRVIGIDWQKVIPDPKKTLKEKPFAPWNTPAYEDLYEYLWKACRRHRIPIQKPFEELRTRPERDPAQWKRGIHRSAGLLRLDGGEDDIKSITGSFSANTGPTPPALPVISTRLKEEALYVRLAGKNIAQLSEMPVSRTPGILQEHTLKGFSEKSGRTPPQRDQRSPSSSWSMWGWDM